MHEFFMVAVVKDSDAIKARAVLQGFCEMRELHKFERIVYFKGPVHASKLANIKNLIKDTRNGRHWAELNTILAKQSYVIPVRYPATEKIVTVGTGDTTMPTNNAVLRWNDIPNVLRAGEAHHMQRRILEIRSADSAGAAQQDTLSKILQDSHYTRKSECVEESYSWVRQSIEYVLVRSLLIPASNMSDEQSSQGDRNAPRSNAPAMFRPFGNFWTLYLRAYTADSSPEKMEAARTSLMAARDSLQGVFNFVVIDRLVFDTRVMAKSSNLPPQLPKVVRV